MSPDVQVALWGAAVAVPLLLNSFTKREPDAIGLAAMLYLLWVFGRVMWTIWSPPTCLRINPLIDSMAGATAFIAWLTYPKRWKLALALAYLAQVGLALDFWIGWSGRPDHDSLYRYILFNNVLFAAEILCVAWPGAASVADSLLGRMLHRPSRLHHEGP